MIIFLMTGMSPVFLNEPVDFTQTAHLLGRRAPCTDDKTGLTTAVKSLIFNLEEFTQNLL